MDNIVLYWYVYYTFVYKYVNKSFPVLMAQ